MIRKAFLTIKTWQEENNFVAYNPELDIASQGKTAVQAQENLQEAVDLFLETTKRMGTLRQVLEEAGFVVKKTKREYKVPQISFSSLEVNI